jgi:hypothetical protein
MSKAEVRREVGILQRRMVNYKIFNALRADSRAQKKRRRCKKSLQGKGTVRLFGTNSLKKGAV